MSKTMHKITPAQFALLQGFMLYVWNKNHGDDKKTKGRFNEDSFWASQLDNADISWHVQNIAAYVMTKREKGWRYFRHLLQSKGIFVEGDPYG